MIEMSEYKNADNPLTVRAGDSESSLIIIAATPGTKRMDDAEYAKAKPVIFTTSQG